MRFTGPHGEHICRTPRIWLTREGTMWTCPVDGIVWVLLVVSEHGIREWERTELKAWTHP